MAKTDLRQQVHNLDELDKQQARLRRMVDNVEENFFGDLFSPQKLAISLASGFIAGKLNSGEKKSKSVRNSAAKNKKNNAVHLLMEPVNALGKVINQPKVGSVLKSVGKSFIRWQLFNLSLFVGKQIIRKIRNRKKTDRHLLQAKRK